MSRADGQDVENITSVVMSLAANARNMRALLDGVEDFELRESLIRLAFNGIEAVLVSIQEAQEYATAKQYEVLYHVLSGLDKGLCGGDGQL